MPFVKSQYFEKRFDWRLRVFCAVQFIFLELLWMPISIYVPALTFNQVTGIDISVISPFVIIVCIIYTSIGGIKGVIWTDVVQSVVMVGSIGLVVIKGTMEIGGLGAFYERASQADRLVAPEWTLDPTVRMSMLAVIIGGTAFKLQAMCISQPAVQRFLTLPDMKAIKKTLIIFITGLIILLGLCMYLGVLAAAAYYDCDPFTTQLVRAKDQIVPLYVQATVNGIPGLMGLFVAGVFSAALSSLSTALNSFSAVILTDFIVPFRKTPLTERQTAIILRSVVIFFGLVSMSMVPFVAKLGLVMQLSSTVGSITTGPTCGIFVVGMMMPFVKTKSVLTGCTTAATVMAYIAIRAQFAIASGELKFPIKTVGVDGCTYEFDHPINATSSIHDAPEAEVEKGIHHLSFLLYSLVGSVITIVVSLLATLYFGRQDSSEVDPMLITPCIRRFLKPYKYSSVQRLAMEKQALTHVGYDAIDCTTFLSKQDQIDETIDDDFDGNIDEKINEKEYEK